MSKSKTPNHQEIIEGFNKLRQEQRGIASKAGELEADKSEHSIVIEALTKVDQNRKCYRLIGGVLVERTVAEVLPALRDNRRQISELADILNKQLAVKGKELNDYKEKHNIRVQGQAPEEQTKGTATHKASGVLVADT